MPETPVFPAAAVAAPHLLAAETGRAILAEGGNAVEATVAMAATIAVVYPHMNAIGGDGFWLVREAGGRVRGIEACGPAGSLATPERYRAKGYDAIPPRGPDAALTVAGDGGRLAPRPRPRRDARRPHAPRDASRRRHPPRPRGRPRLALRGPLSPEGGRSSARRARLRRNLPRRRQGPRGRRAPPDAEARRHPRPSRRGRPRRLLPRRRRPRDRGRPGAHRQPRHPPRPRSVPRHAPRAPERPPSGVRPPTTSRPRPRGSPPS